MQQIWRFAILAALAMTGTATWAAALSPDKPTVLVSGANRGIGLEFVRQYAEDG